MSTERDIRAKAPWVLRLLPVSLSVCGLLGSFFLAELLVRREMAQLSARTEAEAKHVIAQVRAGVLQAFDPLQRIAAWWLSHGRPLDPQDWEEDARLFVKEHAGLRMVTWVSVNAARSLPVRPGVSSAPNAYEKPDPELRQVIEVARRLGSMAISRVFSEGGEPVFYACVPVKRRAKLIGFAAGLYDPAELVHGVLEGQLPDDYSVTVTANGHQIPGFGRRPSRSAVAGEMPITIANTVWSVRVAPSTAEITTIQGLVIGFGGLISLLLYATATMALMSRARAAELAVLNHRLALENEERARAEERIRELNRDLNRRLHDFDVLLEVLPVGIAVAEDPECRKIWMSRSMAGMLQVPLEANISKSSDNAAELTYKNLQNGVEVPPERLPMQLAARTGSPVSNMELDVVRADGSVIHTLSYSAPVFDENGSVRGVINACVDITERKRADEERRSNLVRRRELEQRVDKYQSLAVMAGGIAHDFNNLLTVIIGNANLLAKDAPDDSPAGRRVADLVAAANRAAELTQRLLAYTGQIWCNAEPVNLPEAVASARDALLEVVPANVELKCELPPDLPPVSADVERFQQVLRHVVENAVEALHGSAGTVEISARPCELSSSEVESLYPGQPLVPGRYVRLEVTDNGCGVPEKIAGRVFDPFFTTKFMGRGLGLSAAQGILRAHRGGIRLSRLPEQGTRVEILLPAA